MFYRVKTLELMSEEVDHSPPRADDERPNSGSGSYYPRGRHCRAAWPPQDGDLRAADQAQGGTAVRR